MLTVIVAGVFLGYSKVIPHWRDLAAGFLMHPSIVLATILCAPVLFVLLMTIRSKCYLDFLEKKSDLIPEIVLFVLLVVLIAWMAMAGGAFPWWETFLLQDTEVYPGVITGFVLADCILGIQKLRKKQEM